MNNVLITIGVLIVAVLGALFAVPQFVDWNSYRGVIEEEASRLAGRDVRIGGDIKLELLPSPSFVIHKLRVADQATASGEPMFRADQVAARLSVVPLLRGVLEANEIEVVRPVLRFVLDESGRGNWRSLGRGTGTLPFVPNDVALQSVRITEGLVQVLDRDGARQRLALTQLNGQLSAPALEGPYRFRGTFGGSLQMRELRFTTAPPDVSGVVQVKASLRDMSSGASATLDGKFANLGAEPSLTGEVTAVWPLPGTGKPITTEGKTGGSVPAPQGELKTEIAGDSSRVVLKNLSVAFESAGRPEVLAGEAAFVWGDDVATTIRLAAPWLDLDSVLGTPKGESPLFALAAFAQRVNGLVSTGGSIDASLDIDQANLGHELVGGIRLSAQSKAGMLALDELRAALPGGTRLEVRGNITGQDNATAFDGDMTLQGASLARLGAWIAGGRAMIEPVHDRPVRMRGRIVTEPERLSLTGVEADVGDGLLQGRIDYAWSSTPRLDIAIEGTRIDLRTVLPAKASLRTLADRMAVRGADGTAQKPDQKQDQRPDLSVRLHAAEVTLPDRTLSDVAVALTRNATGLVLERLQFSARRGVSVTLEGRRGADAALDLKGAIAANDREGLATLAELFDVPVARLPDGPLTDVLPLQLAGTFVQGVGVQGSGTSPPVKIVADGRIGTADAKVHMTFDGGFDGWRNAPVEADIVLLGARDALLPGKVLDYLRGIEGQARARSPVLLAESGQPAQVAAQSRLAIRASGRPSQGLLTAARYDSPAAILTFDGRTRPATTGTPELAGTLTIDARNDRDLVGAWMGLDTSRLPPVTGTGTARLELRGGALTLHEIVFANGSGAAAVTTKGRLAAEAVPGASGKQRVSGTLHVSSFDAAALLAPLLQTSPSIVEAASAAAEAAPTGWPTRTFDFGPVAGTDVHVAVRADRLTVSAGAIVTDAQFNYLMRGDGIEVRDFKGRALEGAVAGSALLARVPKGASLAARFALTGGKLDGFGATGTADAVLELAGDGPNPSTLVSALAGKGGVSFSAAQVREIAPASLQVAIDAALKAPPEKVGSALRAALASEAVRVPVAVGTRKVAVTIQDGIARGEPFTVASAAGKATGQGALDLGTFNLSGSWRVETALVPLVAAGGAAQPAPPAVPLPAIVQRFQLRPQDIDAARTLTRMPVEVDALERELAVRKVERDLAELERLRRLDEERAAATARERDGQATAAEGKPSAPPQ